jgi:hypothetical protein
LLYIISIRRLSDSDNDNDYCYHYCLANLNDNDYCYHYCLANLNDNDYCYHYCLANLNDNDYCYHYCLASNTKLTKQRGRGGRCGVGDASAQSVELRAIFSSFKRITNIILDFAIFSSFKKTKRK